MSTEQILKAEAIIGKKAAKMAQNYVHTILRQKLNIHGKGDENTKSILQATKVSHKMGSHRLLGLNFTSSKIGFILHYGFTGVRSATTVYYNAARYNTGSASRSRHNVNMQPKDLFENIYQKSGALDYLVAALSETRSEAIQIRLNNMILKFNSRDGGS